jgi:ribosomal protein S18 acetylase RimI-like enzyme
VANESEHDGHRGIGGVGSASEQPPRERSQPHRRSEPTSIVIDDLQRDDLARIGWSGSESHLRNVAGQLDRRDRGVVEYLVVKVDGEPVCKGAIDYEQLEDTGEIMQVATHPDLEGKGYATRLIAEAEVRIAARGVGRALLSVEPENDRAMGLYLHLGYVPVGEREIGWETDDGGWYSTRVVDLEKRLG